jgi:hypothetical protein
MIMFFDTGVSSVGIVSDLTFQDAQRLHASEKINVDDLIDGHKLIFEQSEKILEYLIK